MNKKKREYYTTLINDTLAGDSNSFAVIYIITCDELYVRCHRAFKSEYDIQDVMFNTYTAVYRNLDNIKDPEKLVDWVNFIFERQITVFFQKRNWNVRAMKDRIKHRKYDNGEVELSRENAERLLESIFMFLGIEANDIPLDSLKAYHNYRTSSLILQRTLIGLAIAAMVLIPFIILKPNVTIEPHPHPDQEIPNLAQYLIKVNSFLPIHRVLGKIDGEEVTIMIEDDNMYKAMVTKNGTLEIEVVSLNRRAVMEYIEVDSIDNDPPYIPEFRIVGDKLIVKVIDNGIGVDYPRTVITQLDGQSSGPITYDAQTGEVTLPHYTEGANLWVYDLYGNSAQFTVS